MMGHYGLIICLLFCFGCGEECPLGSVCERSCPPDTEAMCGPHELCLCAAQKADHPDTLSHEGAVCRSPVHGDLLITEVLIDGEPTEDEEMVELVNRSTDPINLDGVAIMAERSGRFVRKVLFGPTCMPAGTAVATYSDVNRWIWVPAITHPPVADTQRFAFANHRPFKIRLESAQGDTLDQVSGGESLIEPGDSLTREALSLTASWHIHSDIGQGRRRSPGRCPGGGRYVDGCPPISTPQCPSPGERDVVINEVMIDAESDKTGEYVEIINLSNLPRSLSGLELHSNRGEELVRRVVFHSGCLPAMGAVVIFPKEEDWIWTSELPVPARYDSSRLGFPNDAEFDFQLRTSRGRLLDQFSGQRRLIREGVSINRFPDGKGRQLVLHSSIHGVSSSPGLAADGRPFRSGVTGTDSPREVEAERE